MDALQAKPKARSPGHWPVGWYVVCGVLGALSCLSYLSRSRHITAVALLVHAAVMLVYSAWQAKQHLSFNRIFYSMMWLVYAVVMIFYMRSDALSSYLEDAFVMSNGLSVLAGLLIVWTYCGRLLLQCEHLQGQLHFEIQRNHWYAASHHDLWQPLQSVQLYAHALAHARPEQRLRLLGGIQLAIRSVEDLMQQLRCFSVRQKTQTHWLPQEHVVSAHALLSPLITECLPLAHFHRVSLRFRSNRALLRVNATAVQRMLRNLIHNALAYTQAGGSVLIGCRLQGDKLWILCVDNGKGMTPQQLLELLHSALACHASSAPETEVQEAAPILAAVSAELGLSELQ